MKLSDAGLKLIEQFESFRPTAYKPTSKDAWTIGWGHTAGVEQGDTCTYDQAKEWLLDDTKATADLVDYVVHVSLTQNQFDALVSLCFNIGGPAFENSTLLQLLNSGAAKPLVAGQFTRWNKQAGKVLEGLTNRRAKEAALFLTPGA